MREVRSWLWFALMFAIMLALFGCAVPKQTTECKRYTLSGCEVPFFEPGDNHV